MDLVHSQSQTTKERVWAGRVVMRTSGWCCGGSMGNDSPKYGGRLSVRPWSAARTWSGCSAAFATRAQCRRTRPSGPIQTVERITPVVFLPYIVFSPYAP